MASYFRSAALCDQTIAAKAPVPIYQMPEGDEEQVEASAEETAVSTDVNKLQLQDRMGFDTLSGTNLIRAQLDHTSMASKRVNEKRDAKVLAKEATRQHRLEQRLQDEAMRNDRLLQQIQKERQEARMQAESEAEAARQKEQSKLDAEAAVSPYRKLERKQTSAEGDDELTKAVIDTTKIDMFEKIRLEEERQLRHQHTEGVGSNRGAGANGGVNASGGGGIIGMYNNIALSHAVGNTDTAPSGTTNKAKAFPNDYVDGKADAPIQFIPQNVKDLVKDGVGQGKAKEVLERTKEFDSKLGDTFAQYRAEEQTETEKVVEYKARHDRERSQMLLEEVTQENARQRERNEVRDAQLRLTHASTFSDTYGPHAGDVVRGQVVSQHPRHSKDERSLLGYDANNSSHLQGGPVYVHPIDVYQKLVREDMMRARAEEDEMHVASALERM